MCLTMRRMHQFQNYVLLYKSSRFHYCNSKRKHLPIHPNFQLNHNQSRQLEYSHLLLEL
nr:MAG TPA: hypothetical protein [Caudoviricetes sp.]